MKILITGNRGFVGTETERVLSRADHNVIGYDLMDNMDVRDYDQLRSFVLRTLPDRILHLAAIARFNEADADPKLAFETNGQGCANVAKVAAEFHIPVVYSSTGSVYMPINEEPPITENFKVCGNSVYGCSKLLGELYIKQNTPWIILRYSHLYGKEKGLYGLIGSFVTRINRGLAPVLYGGKQSSDFLYIKDVARANLLALTAPWGSWNQVYNIGTGEEISAEKAGKIICESMKYTGEVAVEQSRIVDAPRFVYDCKKAETMLQFVAEYDFATGLNHMFKGETQ